MPAASHAGQRRHERATELEGDPQGAMGKLAASTHPFDRWFTEQAREIHGVDFN